MNAELRRNEIRKMLQNTDKPVSAGAFAAAFSVSRQIIVGDIALLRASGLDIQATPRGYCLPKTEKVPAVKHQIACRHSVQDMQTELYTIVDEGCTVVDVIVEHPIYGQLTGMLSLSSRHDVDSFMDHCRKQDAQPLSLLTEGVHLHTILCPDEAAFERVKQKLGEKGLLLKDE